ncbi:glycerol kinase [Listeria grayi]|uniref:Glycerol kinase n=1 Tax=Listeria grayi TaxID=1641 RepID=A0A378ME90_LISGR|nr:glycerol kinase [Listeria grayi]
MEEKYIIGVDIGTSSTKAVLFDHTGKLIHRHAISYDLITDDAGRAVQDPDTMVDAVKMLFAMLLMKALYLVRTSERSLSVQRCIV